MGSRDLAARYRRWLDSERAAHEAVIRSLESVSEPGRSGPEFRRAIDILAHVAAARRIWLVRLGLAPGPPSEFFPEGRSLAEVARDLEVVFDTWEMHLDHANDDHLASTFDYTASHGKRFRSRVEDILTQLHGHSTYHRGQVAMLVKAAGGEPAMTDFIFWSREPLDDEPA